MFRLLFGERRSITRINAVIHETEVFYSYNRFIHNLYKKQLLLNRKILAQIALLNRSCLYTISNEIDQLPSHILERMGGRRFVTPRQTCPRPEGLGRNLRSKTRWFTGFCNSHQVSHFATFFIDARAEISVAESRFRLYIAALLPNKHRLRVGESRLFSCIFLDTFRAGVWWYPEAMRTIQPKLKSWPRMNA